jgi:hypothetical protein
VAELDLPTAFARDVRTRIHAVLENTDKAVYLGFRVTNDLDPRDPVNLGHVTALLRASCDLVDIHSVVAVYVEVELLRVRAARFRLHRSGAGTDPVLTDPLCAEPPSRICECGLPLDPPEGMQYWRPDRHPDPGPEVYAVAICGESPAARRAVRHEVGVGWREEGTNIHFPGTITWGWVDVGRCAAGGLHPVRRLGL